MTVTSSRQPTSEEIRRPYAPPSHVIAVLQRARSRNLPERITADFLGLSGIPAPMGARTTFTLKFLGLTEEDGSPTEALRAIAAAGESDYRELLTKAIRTAYEADFERIDPGTDSQKALNDAFARYQPRSQTARMVITLLGLCREAGIPVLEAPRKRELAPSARREEHRVRPPVRKPQAPTQARQASDTAAQAETSTLFAVSDSDIAVLGDEEFVEVWAALGKVARARARARYVNRPEGPLPDEESPDAGVQ